MEHLVSEIKKSKKYKGLSRDLIRKHVVKLKERYPKANDKGLLKEIKGELHKLYGAFQTTKVSKREKAFENLKEEYNLKSFNHILATNRSSKERLNAYPTLYGEIFAITGKPKIILDLGCGLNPASWPYMSLENVNYHAYEISEEDVDFLNKFFDIIKEHGLSGKAKVLDAKDIGKLSGLPSSNVVFAFKLFDVLDENNHKISEKIMKELRKKTNFIIVSFATRTLSNKPMKHSKRGWFEMMCSRLKLEQKKIETDNEVFYVVKC